QDAHFMRLAIAEACRCRPVPSAYNVGAVLAHATGAAHGMTILATGYSRELPGNTHAEECCLLKLAPELVQQLGSMDAANAPHRQVTLYTTMEPCVRRLSGRPSCTERLLTAHWIRRIVLGVREPPTFVQGVDGVEQLQTLQGGARQVRVLPGWEAACLAPNQHVLANDSHVLATSAS
ncbi:cytidine deaminase-like protein, partial [Thamnocephalis sphaerospora]